MMTTMSGFNALDSIGGRLYMEENDALTGDVTVFSSLRVIRGQLRIVFHDNLTSLPAFPALRSIGSALEESDVPIDIGF